MHDLHLAAAFRSDVEGGIELGHVAGLDEQLKLPAECLWRQAELGTQQPPTLDLLTIIRVRSATKSRSFIPVFSEKNA